MGTFGDAPVGLKNSWSHAFIKSTMSGNLNSVCLTLTPQESQEDAVSGTFSNFADLQPGGLTHAPQPNVLDWVQSSFLLVVVSIGLAVCPQDGRELKIWTACKRQQGRNSIGGLVPISTILTVLGMFWWCLSTKFWLEAS